MKAFGVRVALVEPGIIDTAMAQRISKNGNRHIRTRRVSRRYSPRL